MENNTYLSRTLKRGLITLTAVSFSITVCAQSFDESFEEARSSFEKYDFSEAVRHLGAAKKKLKNESVTEKSMVESLENQISLAKNYIQRVEKIEILDSITISKEDFFKAYKLPVSAGSLDGAEALPSGMGNEDVEYVFTNEGEDFKIWSQPDSTGFYNIMESILLTDGKWSEPQFAPSSLGGERNAEFPFMMADGVTLYYASDGEDSMGGYDIFVATRDAQTGEYLQPQNIGMPYNSPYDDYLLAIDEENGIGWWATDRNRLGDDLTVYLYKVNETRTNYDPDEDGTDIRDLALIADYRLTQDPEEDYTQLIETVKNIKRDKKKRGDFHFPMKGGKVYTSLDDFQTSGGRSMMKRFLEAEKGLDEDLKELSQLRHRYSDSPSDSLKERILSLEKQVEEERETLKSIRNDVYRAEGN